METVAFVLRYEKEEEPNKEFFTLVKMYDYNREDFSYDFNEVFKRDIEFSLKDKMRAMIEILNRKNIKYKFFLDKENKVTSKYKNGMLNDLLWIFAKDGTEKEYTNSLYTLNCYHFDKENAWVKDYDYWEDQDYIKN